MTLSSGKGSVVLCAVLLGAALVGMLPAAHGGDGGLGPSGADAPTVHSGPAADAGPNRTAIEGQPFTLVGSATPGREWVTVWTEGLESYAPGPLAPPWADESVGGTNYAEISNVRSRSGGQSMHLVDTTAGLGTTAARAVSADAAELTTWALAQQTTGVFTPMLSSPGGSSEWQMVRAGMGPTGTFVYDVCMSGWTASSTSYAAGTWYEIRLVAEIARDAYDMYVDGALVAADVPLCGAASAFDMVRMVSAGSYVGEFFVDDVTYRELRPTPIVDVSWDLNAAEDADGDANYTNDRDLAGASGPVTYGDDGDYLVTLTVTDAIGRTANDTARVTVANAPPRATIGAVSPVSAAVGTTATVDAVDDGSDDLILTWAWSDGPSGTTTFWNGASPDPPMSPNGTHPFARSHEIRRTFPRAGLYTLNVTVEDDDGGAVLVTEVVDARDVPVTTLTIGPPTYVSSTTYVTPSSALSLSAQDRSGLGINATFYRLDGGPATPYVSPFVIATPGAHTVGFWSTDLLGGVEAEVVRDLFVDDAPPTTALGLQGPSVLSGGATWIAPATTLSLDAVDADAGVAAISYRVWHEGTWTAFAPYASPFPLIPGEGLYIVEYYATDHLGNAEPVRNASVRVDATPPEIEYQIVQNNQRYAFVVLLSSVDEGSGVATLEYRVDGGPWTAYDAPLLLEGRGTRAIQFRSADRLGNTAEPAPLLVGPAYVNYKPLLSLVLAALVIATGLALAWRATALKMRTLALTAAFAGIELGMGIASALFDVLLFPPWLGAGLLVNVAFVVAGILLLLAFHRQGARPKPRE